MTPDYGIIDPVTFRNYQKVPYDTFDEKYGLTPELWRLIDSLKVKLGSSGKISGNTLEKIEKLARQHSAMPHFKNILAIIYLKQNKYDRFEEIQKQLIEEFPDYVLARCNMASQYALSKKFDKAAEMLGEYLDLTKLFPQRNGQFTETEIFNYHHTVFEYLIEKEDDKDAQKHLDFLEYYFPEAVDENDLTLKLIAFRWEKMSKEMKKERKVKVIPEYVAPTQKAPEFSHPEVTIFYNSSHDIDKTILDQILSLPRASLIEDMNKMLIDSVARYKHFKKRKWEDKTHSFPLHALFILSVLKAEEGLDAFFTILRQTEEFLDFWYGDWLTEELWQYAYHMGQNRLDRLKDFLLEPNHFSFARIVPTTAIYQIAIHQEHRRKEIIKWYEEIIECMIDKQGDKTIFDTYVYSSLVNDMVLVGEKEQLPFLEKCYGDGLVSNLSVGDLEESKSILAKNATGDYSFISQSIYSSIDEYYNFWKQLVTPMQTDKEPANSPHKLRGNFEKAGLPFIAPPKVGRNDPCSCGSGKKHKKCCG